MKIRAEFSEELDRKLKERDDITRRERNLFIYKVPESTDDNSSIRIQHDKDFIMKLCLELDVKDPKLGSVIRIGKPHRVESGAIDTNQTRPLRITFLEKSERRQILNNAKALKEPSDSDLNNISISRDFTLEERRKRKELEEELKSRKKPVKKTFEL